MSRDKQLVLIVDDDAHIRDALKDTLEDEGYDVALASGGREALALLHGGLRPCLILLDWNMAPMNGAQVMAEIEKIDSWRSVPVVLVTADLHADQKQQAARFSGLLRKPVDLNVLFSYVERYAHHAPC